MIAKASFEFWYKDLDRALCDIICGRAQDATTLLETIEASMKKAATDEGNLSKAIRQVAGGVSIARTHAQARKMDQAERFTERAMYQVDILGIATHGSY